MLNRARTSTSHPYISNNSIMRYDIICISMFINTSNYLDSRIYKKLYIYFVDSTRAFLIYLKSFHFFRKFHEST